MIGTSHAQTVRAVQRVLTEHQHARHAPAVLWASLDEPEAAFALRCAGRQLNGAHRILAAVPYGYAVPAGVQAVPFAPKLFWLFHPSAKEPYNAASGGRGSAKSHGTGTYIPLCMLSTPRLRVLCCREFQQSLRESSHHLLVEKIDELGLTQYFEITDREIRCIPTNSEIIFAGLAKNVRQLKSLEGIGLTWCEEAESVSKESFQILTPTVFRVAGAKVIVTCNPDDPKAPVMGYIDGSRTDVRHVHVTFADNPWFPPELDRERLYLQGVDADMYAHVWEGQCRVASDAQIFKGKYFIEAFQPTDEVEPQKYEKHGKSVVALPRERVWRGPFLGCDFGLRDPAVLILAWICGNTLYIEYEAYKIGCDLDRLPDLFDTVPGARTYTIRADHARPDIIRYLQHHGYPKVQPCAKGKNSIEDGVAFIRSFERVVIHPRATHTIEEFRLYSYEVERLSGDVLPKIADCFNHTIDSLRYALEPVVKHRRPARIDHNFFGRNF